MLINDPFMALEIVIEYLWADELNHYEAATLEGRANHIFCALKVLREWLEHERKSCNASIPELQIMSELED
jgi:hypothetical protein